MYIPAICTSIRMDEVLYIAGRIIIPGMRYGPWEQIIAKYKKSNDELSEHVLGIVMLRERFGHQSGLNLAVYEIDWHASCRVFGRFR
jgi:hypothetical protein